MTKHSSGYPTRFVLIRGAVSKDAEIDENPFPFGGGPEPVPTPEELRERKRTTPRTLRVYQRVAHIFHDCDECHHQIEPGSYYEARVEVRPDKTRYRIMVTKKHLEPRCPIDPHEEELHFGHGESSDDLPMKCSSVA